MATPTNPPTPEEFRDIQAHMAGLEFMMGQIETILKPAAAVFDDSQRKFMVESLDRILWSIDKARDLFTGDQDVRG